MGSGYRRVTVLATPRGQLTPTSSEDCDASRRRGAAAGVSCLKALSHGARAAVRSGEFTPYANVVLHAGVAY